MKTSHLNEKRIFKNKKKPCSSQGDHPIHITPLIYKYISLSPSPPQLMFHHSADLSLSHSLPLSLPPLPPSLPSRRQYLEKLESGNRVRNTNKTTERKTVRAHLLGPRIAIPSDNARLYFMIPFGGCELSV